MLGWFPSAPSEPAESPDGFGTKAFRLTHHKVGLPRIRVVSVSLYALNVANKGISPYIS